MDRIHIRDLAIDCIVGVHPHERTKPQRVILNITLDSDLSRAGATDALADTTDYAALAAAVARVARESACLLIERLAQLVADTCLAFTGVAGVTVTVDKPGALPGARAAAVEIHRQAGGTK
jgi:FolB domain-containing protein